MYGVRGSPTIVFEGKQIMMERNPEKIKEYVCSLLSEQPAVCNETLEYNIAPGFGPINSDNQEYTGGTGSCG